MIPASTKETVQKEKNLYYTVLSFLKDVRKKGKTTQKAMDNLDQFHPETTQLPPLNDMEAIARVSKEFLSQLMEALYYGMLNQTQANLISDEIQDADPECVSTASLEDLLVKLWIGNAKTYRKMVTN